MLQIQGIESEVTPWRDKKHDKFIGFLQFTLGYLLTHLLITEICCCYWSQGGHLIFLLQLKGEGIE